MRMVFDPKMFIFPPYSKCPKCDKADSFGVLLIARNTYARRCRECLHTISNKLPRLNKKIIYLDQFVISEMMKAINKKMNKAKSTDNFWLGLFEKIDKLIKLQLIICPSSSFHQDESAPYQFQAHKRMYEHLSNGSSFHDPGTIRRYQIAEYFRSYIGKGGAPNSRIDRKQIIHGDYNAWQERIRLSVNFDISDKEITEMRNRKERISEMISKTFERWKEEKEKKFEDRFIGEGMAFGKEIIERYFRNLSKYYYVSIGRLAVSAEEWLEIVRNESNEIIVDLQRYLPDKEDQAKRKIFEFLSSEKMLDVPSIRISSLLWAALSDQAAHGGRKKLPSAGIINDISMVASILPYCDAIFVDREMYGLLNHPKVKKDNQARYGTLVYSAANKTDFVEYLDAIERSSSKDHLEKVEEVYGSDWPRPFVSMFDIE